MSQNSSSGGRASFPPKALPGSMAPGGTQNFGGQLPTHYQPGAGIHQYFGERSMNSNFIFKEPGTYNVGVTFNTPNGAGSRDPRTPRPTDSAWTQTTGLAPTPMQGHNMGSQTSPGLKGNFGGHSPIQGGGSQSP